MVKAERRRRQLTVGDAVSDDFNGWALRIADRLVPGLAVAHHAGSSSAFAIQRRLPPDQARSSDSPLHQLPRAKRDSQESDYPRSTA
jgi:hypothetical protein